MPFDNTMKMRSKNTRKVRHYTQPYQGSTSKVQPSAVASPPWSSTAKAAVGLSLLATLGWLLLRFSDVVGVLLVAVLLAYLLYPLADRLRRWTHVSWRIAATAVFLVSVILVIGLITLGGLAIVDQSQSLISFLTGTLNDLPGLVSRLPSFDFGTMHFPPSNLTDLNIIGQELLSMLQPLLTRTTSLLTAIASGAASVIGWIFFAMVVAYFMLSESGGIPGRMISVRIPWYNEDLKKFSSYLSGIWNAFLRGQLTIILISVLVYIVLLSILGVRYAIGLALLAGMARFVPYVGAFVAWSSYGLVAFFQGGNIFGLPPIGYVILVVGLAWITDLILDNFVSARLMGNALKVHPAAVMVSAIIGVNLFGLIGVMLAAPVVATLKLLSEYIINKLLDRDPWHGVRTTPPPLDRSVRMAIKARFFQAKTLLETLLRRRPHRAGS